MKFEPLYLRVKEQIRQDLRTAQATGRADSLPTLDALQVRYSVSRPTISKALAALAAEGVLVKQPGRGTFAISTASESDGLAAGRVTIGYIAPSSGAELAQNVFRGIDRIARRRNCRVLMASSGESVEHERAAAREMIEGGVRGLVIYPALRQGEVHEEDYLKFEDLGVPVVLVDTCSREQGHAQVIFDNKRAGYQVTRWLLEQDRQRIGLIFYTEEAHHAGVEARYQGYLAALRENEVQAHAALVRRLNPADLPNNVDVILDDWLDGGSAPNAIIAIDDLLAMEVIERLSDRGVHVPSDICVVGFDNHVAARRFHPAFTTTNPDFENLGEVACETLLDGIEAGALAAQTYILPVPLAVRKSLSRNGLARELLQR